MEDPNRFKSNREKINLLKTLPSPKTLLINQFKLPSFEVKKLSQQDAYGVLVDCVNQMCNLNLHRPYYKYFNTSNNTKIKSLLYPAFGDSIEVSLIDLKIITIYMVLSWYEVEYNYTDFLHYQYDNIETAYKILN